MTLLVDKVGTEFLVNSQTSGNQTSSAITNLSNGGFVVSWTDFSAGSPDPFGMSIKAQVFTADGAKLGSELLVNTQTAGDQSLSTITGLSDGGFVVSWQDGSSVGDGNSSSIKAQVFSASGVRVGSEFVVNTQTSGAQQQPTITGLRDGGFVVSWQDGSGALGDGDGLGVKGQLFSNAGMKIGGEFVVNTQSSGGQSAAVVTALTDGGFVVSLQDDGTAGGCIRAQLFDGTGSTVGGEILVNTQDAGSQSVPAVAALSGGGFVVTWEDASGTLGDHVPNSIKAQIFDADGAPVGGEFLVNTQIYSSQEAPTITGLPDGGFVVSWVDTSTAGDGSLYSIKAQVYDALGEPIGDELLVNTYTSNIQWQPSVTTLAGGDFVVSWTDRSGTLGDSGSYGIKAQIYSVAENNAPVAFGETKYGDEDAVLSGSVRAEDAEGHAMTYALVEGASDANTHQPVAGLTFNADGSYSFSPPADYNGTVTFSFTANDGYADSAPATIILAISPTQDVPTTAAASEDTTGTEDELVYGRLLPGADVDGDGLMFYRGSTPAVGGTVTIDAMNGDYVFTPDPEFSGTASFTYVVRDSFTDSAEKTVQIAIAAVNDGGPTGDLLLSDMTPTEGQAFSVDVSALSDPDGLGTLSYQWQSSVSLFAWADILLENSDEFIPTQSEVGQLLRVVITYIDGSGFEETIVSEVTGRVGDFIEATVPGEVVIGTPADDILLGTTGAETLYGGAGADVMEGGEGDDTYIVDNVGDQTIELAGEGSDDVSSSISWRLAANIEQLTLAGSGDINGVGNDLANVVIGNAGANYLKGREGNDQLFGGDGEDRLNGGTGADRMDGGSGDDVYYVDNLADTIFEADGRDTVCASITWWLGDDLEVLKLFAGAGDISGIGNAGANVIIGNEGANFIDGGLGRDKLTGGIGEDGFVFATAPSSANYDTITDFTVGEDRILLDDAVFTTLAPGPLADGVFNTAAKPDAQIIYKASTGWLYYDADARGPEGKVHFATLDRDLALGASDFIVF